MVEYECTAKYWNINSKAQIIVMHVITSVITNYIPKARVLAWSVKQFHPDAKFHLVLCDQVPESLDIAKEPFDSVISINELPIPDRESWIFKHSLVELCTAIKGLAFQEILRRYNAEKIFYLDPDIVIFSPLDELLKKLESHSILLTPHQVQTETSLDEIIENEIVFLRYGVFNLGFLAIRTSLEGKKFIDWWSERLRKYCYDDNRRGLFMDQRWVDLAPVFFEGIHIIKDPVYNVAPWNLTLRRATGSLNEGILINGRPLCFYHFSPFDGGAQETMIHKYGGRRPVRMDLRQWYIEECERMGQSEFVHTPWVYGCFENGVNISKQQRILYRSKPDLQDTFTNPFATADVNRSYFHWYMANVNKQDQRLNSNSLDTVEGLREQVISLYLQIDSIKKSRSWRLAEAIKKTAVFLSKVFRVEKFGRLPKAN